jgi:5'-nucleotidase/UDP-sugar diphosphatase
VQPAETSALRELEGDDAIKPYIIKTLDSGAKVGICGITTKVSTEQSSFPDEGTTFVEEAATAQACVDDITAEGVDRIILLTHQGYDNDMTFLTGIGGVDVVVGGHSHSLLGGPELSQFGFAPEAGYAQMINGTCVVTAWEYSKVVGKATIEFDDNGDVRACTGTPVIPINIEKFTVRDVEETYDLEAADAAIVADYLLGFEMFVDYGENQTVIDLIAPFTVQVEEDSLEQIATVPENICHTRGGEIDPLCPGKETLSKLGGGVCTLPIQK